MVTGNLAHKLQPEEIERIDPLAPDPLKYTSVALSEVYSNNTRLEASAFNLEAKAAKYKVEHCRYGFVHLWGKDGMVEKAYHAGRFKRNYVEKGIDDSIGFLGSSEMLNIKPQPIKYIKNDLALDKHLMVSRGTVLLSCSGTIGNTTFVNRTLEKYAFSQHIIRLESENYSGYIYACLNLPEVKNQIFSMMYGAVIQEIEPEHLKNIIIPNAPDFIKRKINSLVVESYDLRDKSNELIDEAEQILYEELQLPPIEQLKPTYFDKDVGLRNYTTKLSGLKLRLDCSYHTPICTTILSLLKKNANEIRYCGDSDITQEVALPTRFKRTYVEATHGTKLIGGKQINELNPSSEKYLAHSDMDDELKLKENSILITRSGTIGKTTIVPKHWTNWIGSDHIIRIIPASDQIAGYLYCWLSTEYALQLIKRNTFGAVVDEIDTAQVQKIEIPIIKNNSKQKEINDKVLQANELRYQAYMKEQDAVKMTAEIIE